MSGRRTLPSTFPYESVVVFIAGALPWAAMNCRQPPARFVVTTLRRRDAPEQDDEIGPHPGKREEVLPRNASRKCSARRYVEPIRGESLCARERPKEGERDGHGGEGVDERGARKAALRRGREISRESRNEHDHHGGDGHRER